MRLRFKNLMRSVPRGGRAWRCYVSRRFATAFVRLVLMTAFVWGCALLATSDATATIVVQLEPRGNPWVHGAGARGLYLGNDFSYPEDGLTNFKFLDMQMAISEGSGDAIIAGTMKRMGGTASERYWDIECLNLFGLVFKKPDGTYLDDFFLPPGQPLTLEMFQSLSQGQNPFGPEDWSDESEWGFEWQSLKMVLRQLVGTSEIPEAGWSGFAMPSMGHNNVAELHYDVGWGLTFEAWYQHNGARNSGGYYNVGDTKAVGTLGQPTVPEPSTYVLGLLGALSLAAIVARRRFTRAV